LTACLHIVRSTTYKQKKREEVVSTDQIVVPCRRRWCSTATSVLRRRGAPSTDGPPRQTRAVAQLPLAPVASTSRRQRAQPPASVDLLDADAGMGKMKNRVGEDKERESGQAARPSPAHRRWKRSCRRRVLFFSETERDRRSDTRGWKWNE